MGIENLKYDIEKSTLEPKRKKSQYERKRLEQKYLIRQKERAKRARVRRVKRDLTYTVCAIALGFLIVWRFSGIYELQSDIETIKGEIRLLSESNEDLNIKISEGISLEKIEKVALEKLDMVYPSREDVVNIVP